MEHATRFAKLVVVQRGFITGVCVSVAAHDNRVAFVDGAQRQFAAAEMPPTSIGHLQFTVHIMASPAAAEAQFPTVVARLRAFFTTMACDPTKLRPVSTWDNGDESRAFACDTIMEGVPVSLLIIAWRDGRLVYTAVSAALSGDQVNELTAILARVKGRSYQDSPVRMDPTTGMRTGVAWDLLPGPEDIPERLVLQREIPTKPAQAGCRHRRGGHG